MSRTRAELRQNPSCISLKLNSHSSERIAHKVDCKLETRFGGRALQIRGDSLICNRE